MTHPRFVFYGGKGGVGKTTCAAARAIVEAGSGARVLIASTDPAHSVGDAFGMKLSTRLTAVRMPGRGGKLDAVELDASRAFARWLRRHREALGDILEHGTWLDRGDVEMLLDLPLPGIDELMGLLEVTRLASLSPYDLVIVDTAPTGHTLRLLAAPRTVHSLAGVLDDLQEQHRYILRRFGRGRPHGRPDAEGAMEEVDDADRLIALIADEAAVTGQTLRDANTTVFHWVTLAEPLSIAESEDAVAALTSSGIAVAEVVVNHVLPRIGTPTAPCALCDRRRRDQRRALAAIREKLGRGRLVRLVPADLHEPRGIRALASLARRMADRAPRLVTEPGTARDRPARARTRSGRDRRAPPESLDFCRGARLLFVAGKGGVGKTTVAAAVAVRLARAMPDRPLLLLSTDPAPSLGDLFGARLGDRAATIERAPANLKVREVDAARVLDDKRVALEAALEEVASSLGSAGVPGGRGGGELMDLAPPGIDELLGMLSVIDARSAYATIVTDMAPTGHALRLLEMPEVARAWIHALLRVLLKYRSLVRPGRVAAELVETSRSIRELQALLRDRKSTRFLVVTRAASVPRAETERLLGRLRRSNLSVGALIVNALTLSAGACPRCEASAEGERRELARLGHAAVRMGGCAIIQTPLVAPPPQGVRALEEWAGHWIA